MAIQYGMSMKEFWHKDKRLYKAYQKAYYTGLSETSWINGLYVNIAINNLASNILSKKGDKRLEYPNEPFKLFDDVSNESTKDSEGDFRQLMCNTTNWLKNRFKNNKEK